MSKASFNSPAAAGYRNHAQVFRDITNIAIQLQDVWQPQVDNILTDSRVYRAYVQMAQDTDALIGEIINGITDKIEDSPFLLDDGAVYLGFHKLLEETRRQFSSRMTITRLILDAAKGENVESALEYWGAYHQSAKAQTGIALKTVIAAIYDFKDGQTMADVLVDNMTMKDFERCNAMLSHSLNADELLGNMSLMLESEGLIGLEKAQAVLGNVIATLDNLEASVQASSLMNAAEKEACTGIVTANSAILRFTAASLDAIMQDDLTVYEKAMQDADAMTMTALQRNAHYYDVLDQHYAGEAKAPVAKKSAKPQTGRGPKAG